MILGRPYHSFFTCLAGLSIIDLISLRPRQTVAYNIDEEYPIVITNRLNGEDAHFGASVLLLPSATGSRNITGWVIIGAPKANASTSVTTSTLNEPGVLWRCALGDFNQSDSSNLCESVEIDPYGSFDPWDRGMPYRDMKNGSWLGGSMFVGDSDRFVSCGSRWVNQKFTDKRTKDRQYFMNGICYWVPKNNMAVDSASVSNWPSISTNMSHRLMPLLKASNQVGSYGYGQFGFSLYVTKDNELISGTPGVFDWTGSIVYYRDNPNPDKYHSRYNREKTSSIFSELLIVPAKSLSKFVNSSDYLGYSVTAGKFFKSDISGGRTQIAAAAPRAAHLSGRVVLFSIEPVDNGTEYAEAKLLPIGEILQGSDTSKGNSYGCYFGYSMLALDVNADGWDELLVSAPLYGTSMRYKRNVPLSPEESAPSTFPIDEQADESKTTTKMKSGDEGCVFVYWSNGDNFLSQPQALCGEKIAGSRFGLAISSLRDVNNDGFNDVAIGAPYENEGKGAVYIYHGGNGAMVLAQKLRPENIDPQINTFGWALSMGEDIDHNGYPDLAVGAYETNQVVIYRTIPLIKFITTLTSTIPKLLSTTNVFNITVCITYTGKGKLPAAIPVWVKLTVDLDPDGKRMVALIDPIDEGARLLNGSVRGDKHVPLSTYQKLIHFGSAVGSCHNFAAVRVASADDFVDVRLVQISAEYRLNYSVTQQDGKVNPVHYEMGLGPTSPQTRLPTPKVNLSRSKSSFGDFYAAKNPLPVGNLIQNDRALHSMSNKFSVDKLRLPVGTVCEGDGNPECHANLTISAWLTDYKSEVVYNATSPFTLGVTDTLVLEIEIENHREIALLPVTLLLSWTHPPIVRRIPSNCLYSGITTTLTCSIAKPIREHRKELVSIELDMRGIYGSLPEHSKLFNLSIEVNTSSPLVSPASHQLTVDIVTAMRPIDFSHTSTKIEYSPGNATISTFGITQAFEIGLEGPSPASKIKMTIDVPVSFELDGNWYDFIGVKKPEVTYDGLMTCDIVNGSFFNDDDRSGKGFEREIHPDDTSDDTDNDYELSKSFKIAGSGISPRLRRSLTPVFSREPEDTYDYGGIVKIRCESNPLGILPMKCLQIVCVGSQFTPSKKAVVELKLKIFNKAAGMLIDSSNLEKVVGHTDYYGIAAVWIESVGVVEMLDETGKIFAEKGSLEYRSRLEIPPPLELPAWILVVSVASGLLVFTLVTLVLKKCGFFHRTKRDLLIKRKVEELEKARLIGDDSGESPSTPSTARLSTLNRPSDSCDKAYKRQSTFLNPIYNKSQNQAASDTSDMYVPSGGEGSIFPVTVSSPATAVRQREMPGAMNLVELRRLYDYVMDDGNEPY